jgi:hypothetical protein
VEGVKDDLLVFRGPRDWDAATEGFRGGTVRGVAYLASMEDVLRLFETNGFETVEIVLGHGLTGPAAIDLKRNLGRESVESVDRLLALMEPGRLKLHIPKAVDHSKYYVIEAQGRVRVLTGSYNLTGSRNVNRVSVIDFDASDETRYRLYMKSFELAKKGSTPFMGDLADLVRGQTGEARNRRIVEWIKGLDLSEDEGKELPVAEVVQAALRSDPAEPFFEMVLPSDSSDRRIFEDYVAPFQVSREGDRVRLDKSRVFAEHGRTAPTKRKTKAQVTKPPSAWLEGDRLIIGLHGSVRVRTAETLDVSEIRAGLDGIEQYLNSVDVGKTRSPTAKERTKATMYEALLYFFAAPFFSEYMRAMHEKFPTQKKGPPFLRIVGDSNCGKSQFALYCLRLMTGSFLTPLHAPTDLTKSKARKAQKYSECFPLVYDDVVGGILSGKEGEILYKSWWEEWWNPERPWPSLIFITNDPRQLTWNKEREKKLLFDVYFENSEKNRNLVNTVITEQNEIYRQFTKVFIEKMRSLPVSGSDPLYAAREAMKELYRVATRPPPTYFPEEPVEKSFDVGRDMFLELINHGKVEIDATTNPVLIHFKEDMQKQMNEYVQHIPGKKRVQGRSVVLDTPEDVMEWIGIDNLPDEVRKAWLAGVKRRTQRAPWWRRTRRER